MRAGDLKDAVSKAMPSDPTPTKEKVRLGPRLIRKIWGVGQTTLKKHGLKSEKGKYDLEEFWEAFAGHINEKQNSAIEETSDGPTNYTQLKIEKTSEEVRKLRIKNDLDEGKTINADDAAIEWSKTLKAIGDVLDGIPSRVKMENPDVPQSVLDTVCRAVNDARNKAAEQ